MNELPVPQVSRDDDTQLPKIEGIPSVDGAYWYFKLGEKLPSLVWIGSDNNGRAIKDGPAIQRYWYPGEFFVGPINPPYETPKELAEPSEDAWREARENPQYLPSVAGKAIQTYEV